MGARSRDHTVGDGGQRSIQSEWSEEEEDRQKNAGRERENQSHQDREPARERASSLQELARDQEAADRGRGRQEIQKLHLAEMASDREEQDRHEKREPGRLEEEECVEAPPLAGAARRNGKPLLPVEKKEQSRGDEVQADDLEEARHSREHTGQEQPLPAPRLDVPQKSQRAPRGKKEVVPGHAAGEVVRQAPGDGEQGDQARKERRAESGGDREDRRNEREEAEKDGQAKRCQPKTEDPEGQRVPVGQPARVDLREIAVGHLAVQDALGRMAEGSFIGRNPPAKPKRKHVNGADEPDKQEEKSPRKSEAPAVRQAGWRRRGAGWLAVSRGCERHASEEVNRFQSRGLRVTGAYGSTTSANDISSSLETCLKAAPGNRRATAEERS